MSISGIAREALCRIAGLEADDVEDDTPLNSLGLNPIMAREVAQELEAVLGYTTLDSSQILQCDDMAGLVHYIESTLPTHMKEAPSSNAPRTTSTIRLRDKQQITEDQTVSGLPISEVQEAFRLAKGATDKFIEEHHMMNYLRDVMPRTTELCVAYLVEALEQLGCRIQSAKPGERLKPVKHLPKYNKFLAHCYQLLSKTASLIDMSGSDMIRTAVACPAQPASVLLVDLLRDEPAHAAELRLTTLTGEALADCLSGKRDGIQVIFGTPQGREMVSELYASAPINRAWIEQLGYFLEQLIGGLPQQGQPLRILELGAGTGGTTSTVAPLLARLGVPVIYTMSDISPSLVSAARKKFKEYPFMEFKVIDLEKTPEQDLLDSQDVILSTACVHATRSLPVSLRNARAMLRPGGVLVLLEQTEQIPWVDSVFGLLEGWWLFEDGREHALSSATHWERVMREVGFVDVDWTEGEHREASLQKLVIAYNQQSNINQAPNLVSRRSIRA